jgi:hypothetical protein
MSRYLESYTYPLVIIQTFEHHQYDLFERPRFKF